MCGINGFLQATPGLRHESMLERVRDMNAAIAHRGPDDRGDWADPETGIALGHLRLAIVDLTATGHQPMVSADGRYVLTFNGEIYNHSDIRAELVAAGVPFRGTSDTEVLLEAIARWGLPGALERTNAMFALAAWDRQEEVLLLARDRLGEKPLYYGSFGGAMVFGSELASVRRHPGWSGRVDVDAAAAFLRAGVVPGTRSIHEGVRKVPPGTIVTVDRTLEARTERYWDLRSVAARGRADLLAMSDVPDAIRSALIDSVRIRSLADVPVGVFLSGGIDSALLVALARRQGPVRTYTIGFSDPSWDEAPAARAVADHLDTEHTEVRVTEQDVLAQVTNLVSAFSEPFADSSQLPTMLLAAITAEHVKVALSGDGGDELFGGYSRYRLPTSRALRWSRAAPPFLRSVARSAISRTSTGVLDRVLSADAVQSRLRLDRPGQKLQRLGSILDASDWWSAYLRLMAPGGSMTRAVGGDAAATEVGPLTCVEDPLDRMLLHDQLTYLVDDLLVKTDRATMFSSLEGRVPFLDHRLVELSWRTPASWKLQGGVGKRVLRHLLAEEVPVDLVDRPKRGFGVPLDRWLRGPLRPWADDLARDGAGDEVLVDQAAVERRWREHLAGRDLAADLWPVLVLRQWLRATGTVV